MFLFNFIHMPVHIWNYLPLSLFLIFFFRMHSMQFHSMSTTFLHSTHLADSRLVHFTHTSNHARRAGEKHEPQCFIGSGKMPSSCRLQSIGNRTVSDIHTRNPWLTADGEPYATFIFHSTVSCESRPGKDYIILFSSSSAVDLARKVFCWLFCYVCCVVGLESFAIQINILGWWWKCCTMGQTNSWSNCVFSAET